MAFWLDRWAGDHAGNVVGREPNTLLVAVTTDAPMLPAGLFQKGDLDGIPWYWNCWVECLTPNARDAIATKITSTGNVFAIEVREIDWGEGKDPWAPGVHLFSVDLLADEGNRSATIATAVISDSDKQFRLAPEQLEAVGPALWSMFRESRTAVGARPGWVVPPEPDRIAEQVPPDPERQGEADRSARRMSGAVDALIGALERQSKDTHLLIEQLQRMR